jgi:mRNA interferase MazF
MYIKEFDKWNVVKKELDKKENSHRVRPGEIRWCSFGVNIGSEIDGKGNSFTRPVIVVSLAGPELALVIPCSTKIHERPWYIHLDTKLKKISACVHQIKVVSTKRLYDRIEKLSSKTVSELKQKIIEFYALS